MMNDERDTEFGYGRTQPEFSLGERMATMEATLAALVESTKERKIETKELFGEKIAGVIQDIGVKDTSQKEAITKAEKAAAETATALATELRTSRETTETRLGALERGGATGLGEKTGTGELAAREYAQRAERIAQRAVTAAIAAGGLTAVAVVVAVIKAVGG